MSFLVFLVVLKPQTREQPEQLTTALVHPSQIRNLKGARSGINKEGFRPDDGDDDDSDNDHDYK